MSDKLFFGEIESQAAKANAEKAARRGTKVTNKPSLKPLPEKDLSATMVAQQNVNQAGGSY